MTVEPALQYAIGYLLAGLLIVVLLGVMIDAINELPLMPRLYIYALVLFISVLAAYFYPMLK